MNSLCKQLEEVDDFIKVGVTSGVLFIWVGKRVLIFYCNQGIQGFLARYYGSQTIK